MNAKELAAQSIKELTELEKTLRKRLFEARFKNHTNQLANTSSLAKTRKDIARVLTVIRQKSEVQAP